MQYDKVKDWTTEKLLKQFCEVNNSHSDPIDLKNYEMMIQVRISDKTDKLSQRIYWLNVFIAIATCVAAGITVLSYCFPK
jgi:hypothetical protein